MAIFRTYLIGALLGLLAVSDNAASQETDAPKTIYYCSGTIETEAGRAPKKTHHTAATSVVLELEAERLVLLGADSTSALKFLRVEQSGPLTIYHFGGIAGEIVYKGTFSVPAFQLRVLGSGEDLQIGIDMVCGGNSPLLLF